MANVITDLRNCTRSFPVYASAARTATPDTQEFEGLGRRSGLIVVFDQTAVTATGTVQITISGVDRISGKTWTILQSTNRSTTGTEVLRVSEGLPATANVSANDLVPPVIRIAATHGNGVSMTYSVTGYLTY
jgi:hypothetical protein